ncbi:hypothetical protein APC57_14890 [Acinetobacter baumannii]|jgi:hypothetical protein|nr:hypothetical protein UO00_05390 [Acinetobacter baumannii]KQG34223.1 hypothetical protein APC38_16160 [Acinetobacter baumannii]KQG97550.1 hypothetical protein APC57_14890 [Acinetobacter baumannii]KRI85020.1 hypothetical protein APC69_01640 [Acinetobacter baumannii]KRI86945.1 hypothetical protein APC69_02770 [Acinetobacter baumannii]
MVCFDDSELETIYTIMLSYGLTDSALSITRIIDQSYYFCHQCQRLIRLEYSEQHLQEHDD